MLWMLAVLLLAGPSSPPDLLLAQGKLKEGQALLKSERYEEAADAFREAIRLDPNLMMAHYGLGQAHMALKQYTSAITAFKGARTAFEARTAEGLNASLENDNRIQERVRDLQDKIRENLNRQLAEGSPEARERDRMISLWEMEMQNLQRSSRSSQPGPPPLPPGLPLALGSAYFRAGQLPEAEKEYRLALEIQPTLGEPRNNLAVVLLLTGRPAEAEEQLKLAEKNGFRVAPGLKEDVQKALAASK
jgi:tetratricopeptide (TPR) repeat protein